jgi:beta-glucosidase
MREIGLTAYRFSIAWPRVMPHGFGDPNPRGLEFYDRLVDELLAAGITPFVTLNHWDTPQTLQERGGWVSRDTAHAFDEYAVAVAERTGGSGAPLDHTQRTVVPVHAGSRTGAACARPPRSRRGTGSRHHLLLSHGWAVSSIRRRSPGAQVGITHILVDVQPPARRMPIATPRARWTEPSTAGTWIRSSAVPIRRT